MARHMPTNNIMEAILRREHLLNFHTLNQAGDNPSLPHQSGRAFPTRLPCLQARLSVSRATKTSGINVDSLLCIANPSSISLGCSLASQLGTETTG